MKPELQNAAIAEACGWTSLRKEPFADELLCRWNELMGTDRNGKHDQHVPNYTGDLNAMHEAEVYAIANIHEFDSFYWIKLAEVTKCSRLDGKQIGHATAAQRSEAFLRTIGKWVEE